MLLEKNFSIKKLHISIYFRLIWSALFFVVCKDKSRVMVSSYIQPGSSFASELII